MIQNLVFNLSQIWNIEVIKKPGPRKVKVRQTIKADQLYIDGKHNRWIVPLYAITEDNLNILRKMHNQNKTILYTDAMAYLLNGVIWEDTIEDYLELPIKKEYVWTHYDYVKGDLLCDSLIVMPKHNSDKYDPTNDLLKNLKMMKKMIQDETK